MSRLRYSRQGTCARKPNVWRSSKSRLETCGTVPKSSDLPAAASAARPYIENSFMAGLTRPRGRGVFSDHFYSPKSTPASRMFSESVKAAGVYAGGLSVSIDALVRDLLPPPYSFLRRRLERGRPHNAAHVLRREELLNGDAARHRPEEAAGLARVAAERFEQTQHLVRHRREAREPRSVLEHRQHL